MRLSQSVLLFAIRLLLWSSDTLAANIPLITRQDQNETKNGNETDTHQDPKSSGTGLGSDPVNTAHGLPHDSRFFEATPGNIDASKYGAAYADWIKSVDKNSTAWGDRLSEPDFFAKAVLEWPDDVNCGIAYNGCDGRPLCDDISERIENRTRARQICYIFDSFHHVSLISAQIHEQSKAAQAAGDAKCRELASTFFWQFDADVQQRCEMISNLVRAGITAIMFGALAMAPLMAPAVMGLEVAAGAEVAIATEAGIGEGAALVESAAGELTVEVEEGAVASVEDQVGLEAGEVNEGAGEGAGGETGGGAGGGAGEGTTGTDGGEAGEGGSVTEGGEGRPGSATNGGEAGEGGSVNEGGEGRPGSATDGGDGGPGSTGDGTNEGPGSTGKSTKAARRVKMPWKWQRSLDKNGKPLARGWHRVDKGKTNVAANMAVALPVTIGGPAMQDSICSQFPNASPEDLEKWTKVMSDRILSAAEEYRTTIDRLLKEVIGGNGFGDDGTFVEPFTSILAETIYTGDYVRLTKYERNIFIEETSKLEMIMTAHFLNAAISVSLKSAMCYLHCTTNTLGNAQHSGDVFSPEPGTFCQPQCWQNWGETRQVKMFGLDTLMNEANHWGTNAREFLTHSYNHWQWSRFHREIMFPTIDQLREGTMSNSTSGAAVPVCYSPQPVQSYDTHVDNLDKALPCICGDDVGNETVSFFREANFQSWVAVEGGQGLAMACQTSFEVDGTGPVQAFLAFCHLGWHFPVESDKHSSDSGNGRKHRFGNGTDVMCEQAEKEAQEVIKKGGSITDVNCNMCWLSDTGKTIKKNQRSYVRHDWNDHRNRYNFQKACEEQVGKKELCKLET